METALQRHYDRFRVNGGYPYGAADALRLARAMARAEDDDTVALEWSEEEDADTSWMDARDLADLRAGRTVMLYLVLRRAGERWPVDSLGGIHLRGYDDPYRKVCEAEMLATYYADVDEKNNRMRAHVESVVAL